MQVKEEAKAAVVPQEAAPTKPRQQAPAKVQAGWPSPARERQLFFSQEEGASKGLTSPWEWAQGFCIQAQAVFPKGQARRTRAYFRVLRALCSL